jgi:hypothetical protein
MTKETDKTAKRLLHHITAFFLFSWLGSCSVGAYQLKWNLILLGSFLGLLFFLAAFVYSRWDQL